MKIKTPLYFLSILLLLSTVTTLTSLAQDSSRYVYWTDWAWAGGTPKIQRANLDGTNVQDLVTGIGHPKGLALDVSAGKMYWTDKSTNIHEKPNARNRVLRANLDGTNIETLVITWNTPQSIYTYFDMALDTAAGKMYWAVWSETNDGNKIQRANLDGTNIEDIVIVNEGPNPHGHRGPRGIALDLSQEKIYYTHLGIGKIQRANLDGTNVEDIVTGLVTPVGLGFSGGKMYWTDWNAGKIQRANLDGTNVEDLVNGLNFPAAITLDSLNGKMYWAHFGGSKIHRANLDGTNIENITTNLDSPWGIALGVPQTRVSFSLPSSVSAGETFTAALNIADAVDLAGAQLNIHFDPAVLETTDIQEGDFLSGEGVFFQVEGFKTVQGEISGIRIAHANGVTGGGTLLKVVFKAKAAGVSALEARDLRLGNSVGGRLPSQAIAAQVEVLPKPDVNGDGKVNILDMVFITRHFGPASAAPPGVDINGDGEIDIIDLILVTQHLRSN